MMCWRITDMMLLRISTWLLLRGIATHRGHGRVADAVHSRHLGRAIWGLGRHAVLLLLLRRGKAVTLLISTIIVILRADGRAHTL
jgi:hypothetical protein